MTFTIANKQSFRGIPPFQSRVMKPLSVITGINGVGKSNLLVGLADGRIECSLFGEALFADMALPEEEDIPFRNEVVLLTARDTLPAMLSVTSSVGIVDVRSKPVAGGAVFDNAAHFSTGRQSLLAEHLDHLRSIIPIKELVPDPSDDWEADVWANGPDALILAAANAGLVINEEEVRRCFNIAEQQLEFINCESALGQLAFQVHSLSDKTGKPKLAISPAALSRFCNQLVMDRFNSNVSQAFSSYIQRYHQNISAIAQGIYLGTPLGLDLDQFAKVNGPPPWNLVNDALLVMGLNYEVVEPDLFDNNVRFSLRRKADGKDVRLFDLSSGEQVLLRFALSTYQFDEANLVLTIPKLLLLDEVDASLHPAFVARWIKSIIGLAESEGISIILTTHSPTTVALAPEGSVFEMAQADPTPRSVTRQHAIDRLTFGLPALTIDSSARRQIFVESSNDARWYDALVGQLKGRVDFKRGLGFVSARKEKPTGQGGDDAGGCSLARSVVENLVERGVPSLFGLLDWDNGRNLPDKRIVILGIGTHYAIENVLLDPLLIGAVLVRGQASAYDYPIGLSDLLSKSPKTLQKLIDFVASKVPFAQEDDRLMVASRYFGGLELRVPAGFQTMKGHELEKLVCSHLHPLSRWSGKGRLLDTIISEVIGLDLDLCPLPIVDALTTLSNSEFVD
ncbi:ATP-binding protein [Sphingomonas sp. UV9]|uniref:AAA family ATPase n=1 Tax=Sphingomonas sp. UV9 TaxID=1851410 RepID=UPI000FFC3334|nr:AAA family ATPase [Sphingomonas sp. UV9]RXD02503.1 ATP-binding protein [Sphingomonas sp. UV9]